MSDEPILVIGAGAWGSALANVFARAGNRTLLWDADAGALEHIAATRRHPAVATDVIFDERVEVCFEPAACTRVALVVLVVPFQVLGKAAAALAANGPEIAAVACASKGIETGTQRVAHEIVAAVWPPSVPFAQLSGPNFAAEVLRGAPSAISIGASSRQFGADLAARLHGPRFRPYYTDDVIGVELGGALKNVIAIGAGIADGLGFGANTRAALVTRGLAEIARYGCARGGRMETFMGLSGMGDLVLTCTDDQSRNRRFGLALAREGDVERAAEAVGALVEGVATAEAIARAAHDEALYMPIASAISEVLSGALRPAEAVERLLTREPGPEVA